MYATQFAAILAIVDVLDTGLTCADGACTTHVGVSDGCGNQVEYNGMLNGNGSANAVAGSYNTLAGILTDDELFVDTTIGMADIPSSHANYLAVEFNALSGVPNSTCGGRAPTNDVIDTSYTALAVKAALDKGQKLVIIDARPESEWMTVHITGAVSIPHYQLKRLDEIPKDAWIIAYCACPHHLSGIVVDELQKRGYTHAGVLDEGILDWQRRGFPIVAAAGA